MRIPRSLVVVVAATAIGAAACGSTKSSTAATTTPTTQAPTTTTAAPATTTTIDAAAATAQITANFTKFFDGADPDVNGKLAVLQNGDNAALKALFIKGSANKAAAGTFVKVSKVTLQATSDCTDNGYTLPCALVNYDLYLKPNLTTPVLTEKGYAVLDSGVWKISRTAYCVLSALGGNTCPPA